MDKKIIIEKLKRIKPELARKYGVTDLALFGSYSRGEQTRESDIDILVDFNEPIGLAYLDLAYDLQGLFSNEKVQVVSKGGIKPHYFERLKNELIYA